MANINVLDELALTTNFICHNITPMKTQWCPKCKSKVALVPGMAVINPVGKLNRIGQFIPASEVSDGGNGVSGSRKRGRRSR